MLTLSVADNIATLTMNNPPVNAMSDAWVASFHAHLDALDARDDWAVLHIRSALKFFCAASASGVPSGSGQKSKGGGGTPPSRGLPNFPRAHD